MKKYRAPIAVYNAATANPAVLPEMNKHDDPGAGQTVFIVYGHDGKYIG